MVKVTIIGWYGTETIGDRGILAGVIRVLFKSIPDANIKLGTIFPFFTERTLIEDEMFLRSCCEQSDLSISLFDSSKSKELDKAIRWADYLVIGGGPLEDIPSMFMLEYAVKKAKIIGKRILLLGCGIGPLYKTLYQKSMIQIVNHADAVIFRDDRSVLEYMRLSGKKSDCIVAIDPAVFALIHYKKENVCTIEKQNHLVISIRKFSAEYKMNNGIRVGDVNLRIQRYIEKIQQISGMDILLVPMHYFGIGNDDRYFMNDFRFNNGTRKIMVQNRVLTMEETMKLFTEAKLCVGMRFHSVVFQTILNGRNLIWDYTDPQTGKIGAFISQMNITAFYHDRYLNLQTDHDKEMSIPETSFSIDTDLISGYEQTYISAISNILNK